MAWISSNGIGLLTGDKAGTAVSPGVFDRFFEAFQEIIEVSLEDLDHEQILERIANGSADDIIPAEYQGTVKKVASALIDADVGNKVGTMRSPLRDVLDQATQKPVDVLWPHREWSVGPVVTAKIPIGLELKAGGGIRYQLAPESDLPVPIGSTRASLTFQGDAKFGAKVSVPVQTLGGIEAAGSIDTNRRLSYALQYDRNLLTWRAVADSFSRVRRIDNFKSVLRSFDEKPPKVDAGSAPLAGRALDGIIFEGGENLQLNAGLTLRVPLANYGTVRGSAGGQLKFGGGFKLSIRKRRAPGRPPALVLTAESRKSFEREGKVGIGYGFGISDLAPSTAKSLLNAVVSAGDILEKVDTVLADGNTYLKPGTILKEFISGEIKQRIDNRNGVRETALRVALGDVLGIDQRAQDLDLISGQAAGLIATLLDNASGLFGPDLKKSVSDLLAPILEQAESNARKKLEEISERVGDKLKEHVDGIVTQIDTGVHKEIAILLGRDPGALIEDLKEFLNIARSTLSKISDGISKSNLDLIAGEIAWSLGAEDEAITSFSAEIEEVGKEFYRSAIWRPSTGAARLLELSSDNTTGVRALEAQDSRTLRRLRGPSWNVGLVDTPVTDQMLFGTGGKRKTFAEAKVERTLSGVTVGSQSWNKIRRDTDFLFREGSARAVEFADALSFVNASDAVEPNNGIGEPKAPIGRLSLAYTWEEPNFGPREIVRFAESFKECGLVGSEGADALVALRQEVAEETGDRKPEAELRALLVVPSDFAVRVIEFVAGSRSIARDIVESVVSSDPFSDADFSPREIGALLDYFAHLESAKDLMMGLRIDASEEVRSELRDSLASSSQAAQKNLRRTGWLDTSGPLGPFSIALGPPPLRLRALFVCLAELTAAAPGVPRPGMVYGFTPKDQPTKFVISPNAGVHADASGNE